MLLPGQTGRDPSGQLAARFAAALRRQGFLPSVHFVHRLLQRALRQGVRVSSDTFGNEFFRARHYRQTRPGYTTRIAVVRGVPILYRLGGRRGDSIVLVGVLPEGDMPPVAPISPPRIRDAEYMAMSPRDQRAIDAADQASHAADLAGFDVDVTHGLEIRAMRAAQGSGPALLQAGRAVRRAQQDLAAAERAFLAASQVGDRDAQRSAGQQRNDAEERLRRSRTQYQEHRTRLIQLRQARRLSRVAQERNMQLLNQAGVATAAAARQVREPWHRRVLRRLVR